MAKSAANLVAYLQASMEWFTYPMSSPLRLEIYRKILEISLRRLQEPLVLVTPYPAGSHIPEFDDPQTGTVSLVADRIEGKVRVMVKMEYPEGSELWNIPPGPIDEDDLVVQLHEWVEQSINDGDNNGDGEVWYKLLSRNSQEWEIDKHIKAAECFVNDSYGVLWNHMKPSHEWKTARTAWMAFHSPFKRSYRVRDNDGNDMTPDLAEMTEGESIRAILASPFLKKTERKWPEDKAPAEYTEEELQLAHRILAEAATAELDLEVDSIPIRELRKVGGLTVQQMACYYLAVRQKWPTPRIAKRLGFNDHRDVAEAVRAAKRRIKSL